MDKMKEEHQASETPKAGTPLAPQQPMAGGMPGAPGMAGGIPGAGMAAGGMPGMAGGMPGAVV